MRSPTKAYLWLFFLALWTTWSPIDCRPKTAQRATCETEACKKSAQIILSSLDGTADPCDDFYQYACGGFVSKNEIPDDKTWISLFGFLDDLVARQIRESLEQPVDPTESEALKKCKSYYQSCIDTETIEKLGTSKVKEDFQESGGWPVVEGDAWKEKEFDWIQMIFKLEGLGYDTNSLFGISLTTDLRDSTKLLLDLGQPPLGIPRKYLLNGTSTERVRAYSSYVKDMAFLFGGKDELIHKEIGEVIQFEIEMAKISLSEEDQWNVTLTDNPMSLKEVDEKFSYFPWLSFINYIFGSNNFLNESEIINVSTPKYLEDLGQLLSETPKRVLANFLFSKIFLDIVDYLPEKFLKRRDTYREQVDGNSARPPRYKTCVDEVYKRLSLGISNLFVKNYFKNGTKEAATVMVNELRESARRNIISASWMDNKTRENALAKLEAMQSTVGYPDELLDDEKVDEYYKDIIVDEKSYFITSINVKKFATKNALNKLKKPLPKGDWKEKGSVAVVNAFYNPGDNSIMIPAGILQDIFFDVDRPQYMNFGGIGATIGHEITHGFDDRGSQFDKDGNFVDWWSPETLEAFKNKTQCMIEQYSNVSVPEVAKHLNGVQTLGENIADNGGLKEAYEAYNEWLKTNGEEPGLPGIDMSPKQLFWVSYANTWCSKRNEKSMVKQIDTNVHSPEKYRVNVPLGNSKDFIRDFKCKEGTKMNPSTKCSVW